jgi:hypothetical protein
LLKYTLGSGNDDLHNQIGLKKWGLRINQKWEKFDMMSLWKGKDAFA